MRFHITTINNMGGPAQVAQNKTADIAHSLGWNIMGIFHYPVNTDNDNELFHRLDGTIGLLKNTDVVMFQYPSWNEIRYDEALVSRLKMYAKKVVIYVHDIDALLYGALKGESLRAHLQRIIRLLEQADLLILASPKLYETLTEYGLKNKKVIYQTIWDFPISYAYTKHECLRRMVFAGADDLDAYCGETIIHQFGRKESTNKSIIARGWYEENDLIKELSNGGFGLVYADNELFERYDCMNQSYKMASYLAAGIPVFVRKGSAIEDFVVSNDIGYAINSIEDADQIVKNITDDRFRQLYNNVSGIQQLITSGAYTKRLLLETEIKVFENSI